MIENKILLSKKEWKRYKKEMKRLKKEVDILKIYNDEWRKTRYIELSLNKANLIVEVRWLSKQQQQLNLIILDELGFPLRREGLNYVVYYKDGVAFKTVNYRTSKKEIIYDVYKFRKNRENYTQFHSNGEKYIEYNYRNDNFFGLQREWNEQGVLIFKKRFYKEEEQDC